LDVSIPTGFVNDQCDFCESFDADTYSLTAQAISITRCQGGDFSELPGGCSWLYQEPDVCRSGGYIVNLLILGRLRRSEEGECTLEVILRLESVLALTHLCQEWRYETFQSSAWSDCESREWTLDLVDNEGCFAEGASGSFPCSFCTDPPATITVQ